jgi:DNA-binding protein HU-beta
VPASIEVPKVSKGPNPSKRGADVNKSELVDAAAERSGVAKGDVAKSLDGVIEAITDAVRSGEKVSITGFGNFERRQRSARMARNPQTGAEIHVPASKAPAFKPGKAFKDAVNI